MLIFSRRSLDSPRFAGPALSCRDRRKAIDYFVSWGKAGDRGIVSRLTLNDARALACQLLSGGAMDVAIGSTAGLCISGAPLAACCRKEKLSTFDLQPIERTK